MSLRDVQSILLSMFYEDTILLGHSLESDLRSLKVSAYQTVYTYFIRGWGERAMLASSSAKQFLVYFIF